MNKTVKTIMIFLLGLLLFTSAGCLNTGKPGGENTRPPAGNTPVKPQVKKEVTVELYFPDRSGLGLYAVKKKVPAENKYRNAVQELINGTKEKKLMGVFPPGTKIRSLKVQNGRAYVDFSRELADNFPGGAMVEEMLIGSVVNTLTAFPEIKTVKLSIAGRDNIILSNMDMIDPYERMNELIKK